MLNIEQKYALRLEKYMCICTEKKENTEKELTDKQWEECVRKRKKSTLFFTLYHLNFCKENV